MSGEHWPTSNRTEPYTAAGIKRRPCVRCGRAGFAAWQACADGGHYRPLCVLCDVALNALVLRWAGDPLAELKLERYALAQDVNLCDVEGFSHRYESEVVSVSYAPLGSAPGSGVVRAMRCRHCGQGPS